MIFPASCLHRQIPCSLYPGFLSGRDGHTSLALVFLRPQIAICPLKRMRVLAKYHVADFRQIHWLEARSPWKGSFLVGSVNVVDCKQSLFCYENRWASAIFYTWGEAVSSELCWRQYSRPRRSRTPTSYRNRSQIFEQKRDSSVQKYLKLRGNSIDAGASSLSTTLTANNSLTNLDLRNTEQYRSRWCSFLKEAS